MFVFPDEVRAFSKSCVKEGILSNNTYENKELMTKDINNRILNLIYKWKEQQLSKLSRLDSNEGILNL